MSYLISVNEKNSGHTDYLKNENILLYLKTELNKTKSRIDNHIHEWERAKKQIHDYEYVYYSSYRKKNISSISPVSRSYFKFREIYFEYNIHIENNSKICTLAEAPGGFIQSIIHLLPENTHVKIMANSLVSNDKSIPTWNNTIKRFNIEFIYGRNNNGDLCDFINLLSMIKTQGKSSCSLVTGDGGFDFSSDYSKQEFNSLRLIYSEIFMALNLQAKGGSFICKVFDTFMTETIDLLYLLNLSYGRVYLHKPKMSRNSNSEKYIICLDFKGYNKELVNIMCHSFVSLSLNFNPDCHFRDNLLKYIIEYTLQQIKSINKGIHLLENEGCQGYPTEEQLRISISWCKKYNIQINNKCIYLNNLERPQ